MNWIKQKLNKTLNWIKKKFIWLFIGSTVLAAPLVFNQEISTAVQTQRINSEITSMESLVDLDRQKNGKYKRIGKQIKNGVEYEVHEYETSKGELGYVIYITKEENNIVYKKAIATGVEKASREFNWKKIKDNNPITATTTTATTTKQ